MGVRINFAHLSKYEITQKEYYLVLAIHANPNFPQAGSPQIFQNLIDKGFIVCSNSMLNLTVKGRKLIKHTAYAVEDTEYTVSIEDLATKLRALFPEGKKGQTPYYWRGNSKEIEEKLTNFFKKNPTYTEEQVIAATQRYVNSYTSTGDLTFMQLLKYFIEKDGNSSLLTFLENYTEEEAIVKTGDWTSNLI